MRMFTVGVSVDALPYAGPARMTKEAAVDAFVAIAIANGEIADEMNRVGQCLKDAEPETLVYAYGGDEAMCVYPIDVDLRGAHMFVTDIEGDMAASVMANEEEVEAERLRFEAEYGEDGAREGRWTTHEI